MKQLMTGLKAVDYRKFGEVMSSGPRAQANSYNITDKSVCFNSRDANNCEGMDVYDLKHIGEAVNHQPDACDAFDQRFQANRHNRPHAKRV